MFSQAKPNITYYTDALFEYDVYKLCEFKLKDHKLFSKPQEDLLKDLFTTHTDTYILDLYIYDEILKLGYSPVLKSNGLPPPFTYSNLDIEEDLVYYKDKLAFQESMNRFIKKETDCADGTFDEERSVFFRSAISRLYERTILEHGIWKLSLNNIRERIPVEEENLHRKYRPLTSMIFDYYEQYIEIDTEAQVIRVLLFMCD